jgi:hypothetical protein
MVLSSGVRWKVLGSCLFRKFSEFPKCSPVTSVVVSRHFFLPRVQECRVAGNLSTLMEVGDKELNIVYRNKCEPDISNSLVSRDLGREAQQRTQAKNA